MRISELAQQAGVPLSAIKYYQREDLVPEGRRTAPNQVDYGDAHLRRVRLIRALLSTGGLSIGATKEVIAALDADEADLSAAFEVAQHAMSAPRPEQAAPSEESRQAVLGLARDRDWRVRDDNPGVDVAARALDGLTTIDFDARTFYLDAFAQAAETAAAADLRALADLTDRDQIAELMVVGSVLGDPLFAGLRRLAQEDATQTFFPATPDRESRS